MAVPFENTLDVLRRDSAGTGRLLTIAGAAIMCIWLIAALTLALPLTISSIDGRIISAVEPTEITSTSEAPIVSIPFKLGDTVKAGEVLIAFDAVPEELELEGVRQRTVTLEQELLAADRELASLAASLMNELDGYDRAIEGLEARAGEVRAEIEHATNAEALYSQLRSERRIDALEYSRARSSLEQSKMQLQALQAESKETLANRRLAINRSETQQAQLTREQARLRGTIAELRPEYQRLENRISELVVRAPFSGEIGAIARISNGQRVTLGAWLMTLVPDREFEFQATFAAREAAGRIETGQIARIQFHALPWTEYGTLDATVLRVGSEEREAAVRVDFALSPDSALAAYLDHGLKGQAVVQIHEATLMQRLLNLLGTPRSSALAINR